MFEDKRAKKIIFLSSCILNQNNRFPGIALYSGAISDLITPLLKAGIGLEQLPCLECMGWGGVSRKSIFKFLPTIFKHENSKLIKIFSKLWLWKFKRNCKKEAKKIVNRIKDYLTSGYEISGIIAMNDSPTCGITKTINILNLIFNYAELGIDKEDLEHPNYEQMKSIMPKIIIEGKGYFMQKLTSRLRKKKIDIELIGFDPWIDISIEVERIKKIVLME
jgi:predicted secreted protein